MRYISRQALKPLHLPTSLQVSQGGEKQQFAPASRLPAVAQGKTLMDRRSIFGGNPLGVIVRLILASIVVGIVLSALGITPQNFLYHIEVLLRRIYDLGFGAIDWLLQYLLLGAIVVIPIWIVARIFGIAGNRSKDGEP